MTNAERAKVNRSALKKIADDIENIRIELYSYNVIDDVNDKQEFDDNLFRIQSELRNVSEELEYWED